MDYRSLTITAVGVNKAASWLMETGMIHDDDDESLIACRPESWPMARGSYQRAPGSI